MSDAAEQSGAAETAGTGSGRGPDGGGARQGEIAVLGAGMRPWGKWGRNFVEYGIAAANDALADAGLQWSDVQYVSGADTMRNGYPGYAAGATFAQALGWTGARVAPSPDQETAMRIPTSFELDRRAKALRREEISHLLDEAVRAIRGWGSSPGRAPSAPGAARGPAPARA